MTHDLGILALRDPLQGLCALPVGLDNEMLQKVIHTAHTIFCRTRTPDETVQQDRNDGWSGKQKSLNDVWMPLEQLVRAVEISLPICSDCQEVFNDGRCSIQSPTLNCLGMFASWAYDGSTPDRPASEALYTLPKKFNSFCFLAEISDAMRNYIGEATQ